MGQELVLVMALEFKNSPKPTIGIEVEIQLIDPHTKNLRGDAVAIIEEAKSVPGLTLKAEMLQAMVEINTEICQNVPEAGKSLARQILQVHELCKKLNLEIAVSGTHPFQDWRDHEVFPDERHLDILEKYQWLARRLISFGMHVHVGIRDGDRAIHIVNALISYLPHLLALSASSPYWAGTDTGLMSCRAALLESFPMGGLPYYLPDWKGFEKYFETQVAMGAIKSIKDIYWDIRPHFDFGTVEVRICDGLPNLKDTLALAAMVHSLVVWIDDQYQKGRSRKIHMERYWLAPENKWQAVRYGFEGVLIDPQSGEKRVVREDIERLLENLAPVAETLGCRKELSHIKEILKHGNSSMRQREIFARTHSHAAIVDSLIHEFRSW